MSDQRPATSSSQSSERALGLGANGGGAGAIHRLGGPPERVTGGPVLGPPDGVLDLGDGDKMASGSGSSREPARSSVRSSSR